MVERTVRPVPSAKITGSPTSAAVDVLDKCIPDGPDPVAHVRVTAIGAGFSAIECNMRRHQVAVLAAELVALEIGEGQIGVIGHAEDFTRHKAIAGACLEQQVDGFVQTPTGIGRILRHTQLMQHQGAEIGADLASRCWMGSQGGRSESDTISLGRVGQTIGTDMSLGADKQGQTLLDIR